MNPVPPVRIFSITNKLRGIFKKLYYAFVPANMAVFEKSQGFWTAKAISVACELNLAEILGDEKRSVNEIAKKASADASALYRLMRALAGEGIFKETETGYFKNTHLSNALKEQPGHLKNMIMHQLNSTNWEVVNEMKHSVVSGENAAQKLFGTDIFTHLENTPEKNALYNKAMTETSRLSSTSMVAAYSFRNINTLVDLGGGEGMLLYAILQKNEKLKGVLFDLSHVVTTAAQLAKDYDVEKRVQIIPGSFFKDKLPVSDAYLLKNILHAFDDETCTTLLKKVHNALDQKGKILVIETVIGEDNKYEFGKMFDLQMLIGTENGKERTKNEFRSIFETAGFRLNRVIKTVSPFCIVEGVKK